MSCDIQLANPASEAKDRIQEQAQKALLDLPDVEEANVAMTWEVAATAPGAPRELPGGQSAPASESPSSHDRDNSLW